jgi:hypothetical protein
VTLLKRLPPTIRSRIVPVGGEAMAGPADRPNGIVSLDCLRGTAMSSIDHVRHFR